MRVTRSVSAFKYTLYVKQLNVAFYNASSLFQVKVRAKLSKPHQRGRGKHASHGGHFSGRNPRRMARPSRSRPPPRSVPARMVRGVGSRAGPVSVRDRRPLKSMPVRARPVAPPVRSRDRRPAGMDYIFSFLADFLLLIFL